METGKQTSCEPIELHGGLQGSITCSTNWSSADKMKTSLLDEAGENNVGLEAGVCQPPVLKNNVHSNGSEAIFDDMISCKVKNLSGSQIVANATELHDNATSKLTEHLTTHSSKHQPEKDNLLVECEGLSEDVKPYGSNGENYGIKITSEPKSMQNCNGQNHGTLPNSVIQNCADTRKSSHHDVSLQVHTSQTQQKVDKMEAKSENVRPMGRLLHDLGLELVREQVYCDLIEIQTAKNASNKLELHEKSQLLKLVEAHERLRARNAPYRLPTKQCSKCNFASFSLNAMVLHRQYGSFSRTDPAARVCCACFVGHNFSTRSATGFIAHLSEEHNITGRLQKKSASFSCTNCPYEHRSSARIQVHMAKCLKKYPVVCNLQPLPGDCDIALIYRTGDRGRPVLPSTNPAWPMSPTASVGHPSVRNLLDSIRSQHKASTPTEASMSNCVNLPMSSTSSLICEICGKVVDGREALWNHFRVVHQVELSNTTMREQDPWMKCDVCSGRFWTYQGLSRHLLLAHNRAIAANYTGSNSMSSSISSSSPILPVSARCHLCGGSQTANPLSHFSAYHNVTLLEMYHAKLCCLCNSKLNSGRAFEEHMVEQHSDIFANHDVLRTVLQALTTARCFKSDDSRHASVARSVVNVGQVSNKIQQVRSVHPAIKTNKHSIALSLNTTRTVKRKQTVSSEPTTLIKSPEKAATAEQVKKLYEELADIGRPILRSMRHKLGTAVLSSDVEVDQSSTSAVPSESDGIPLKKICLGGDSLRCDVVPALTD